MVDRKKSIQAFCELLDDLGGEEDPLATERKVVIYLKNGGSLTADLFFFVPGEKDNLYFISDKKRKKA